MLNEAECGEEEKIQRIKDIQNQSNMRTKCEADQQAFTNSQKLLDDTSNHYKRSRKPLPISDVTS